MIEEWKPAKGYEEYFRVSNTGKIFSLRSNKVLKTHITPNGREAFATKFGGREGKDVCFKVHRLVAETWIDNPENKPTVNHIDGNPLNNTSINLEWNTYSENIQHAYKNGLIVPLKGEDCPSAKLTVDDVTLIRQVYKPYCKLFGARALARKYKVTHQTILSALNHKSWVIK